MTRQGRRSIGGLVLLGLLGGQISEAAASVLILRSVGPSAPRYPVGRRISDDATLTLRPGDAVVILGLTGTRHFRGPGLFRPNGPPVFVQARLARGETGAVRGAEQVTPYRRRQTGAVRGDGRPLAIPTDPWQYDVSQSGTACVIADRQLTLWRPSAERALQLSLTLPSGEVRTIAWPAQQQTLTLPGDLRLEDGARYQLTWTGGTSPTGMMVATIPAPATPEATAEQLLTHRCRGQLDAFIASSEDPQDREQGSAPPAR
jgi:hypothetical protein